MRKPDCGPLGDTFLEASTRAIVGARLVNNPLGGYVDTVLTFATHRFDFLPGIGCHSFCVNFRTARAGLTTPLRTSCDLV